MSWNWIASELQASLAKSQGAYPARTAAQLNDFIGTIRQELTMTENQATQREKAQLYVDYHDEIQTIQDAFDQQWERFADDWGRRLAQKLDTGDIIDIPNLSDNHVAIDLNADTSESMRWIFRQGSSWASIAREQWRRRTDDHTVIHSSRDDDDYAQVMLYHRLEKDRQQAIQDRVLELTLWHGTSSDEAFWNMVNNRLDDQIETQGYTLPPSVSLTGRPGSILSTTYSIPVDEHDDFFDAYTAALRNAFIDFAVENYQLSALITDAFEHSLEDYH
ncbi:MAG: hypothetical protein A07HR60_02419 [uncultured archaeon A07HR60]|nr:MAG: hypothetical protein A07HR60_02419 [uncultured archaeon A07HR60]